MFPFIFLCFLVCIAVGQDVPNLPGPFRLVTTDSLIVPVVPTSQLFLYYNNINIDRTGGLNLVSAPLDFGGAETFRLINGVLGTLDRPDDVAGDLPWNATTPPTQGAVTFNELAAAHAGFDFVNSTFLAIHGILANTWYLCADTNGFGLLTYKGTGSGCSFTYVAAYS